ncbi:LOW QUALITY PROTEIN: uncharacterized protein LOC125954053 [Anopheles darlingi]|uniref:LOW QUALITY PROTEIN: uncharacterized protein LOC125954053 n=1 Tax=Anopheles darlingi TaxID=43151 RepID=UPI00210009D9|nr:LOW QUALITY PROTEIN: uncharacterized protein LOC125954053 [Anopheles darlingi]
MSATATPIFITVPTKYIPINVTTMGGVPVKPLAKRPPPATSVAPSSIGSDDECSSSMDEFIVRHKKRRLDHLTHEEKMQRKKLKNRVAAQTSRDRKKAKMEDMEKTIAEQSEQISALERRCSELDAEKGAINEKYLGLERRFEELQQRLIANEQEQKRREQEQAAAAAAIKREMLEPLLVPGDGSVGCVTAGRQTGSAASSRCPQQQGRQGVPAVAQTTLPPTSDERLAALWKHCHMPTLQDMLDDFDISQLEELAESLLADVGADLESTDRTGSPSSTEDDGTGGRLSRSVVGSAAELVESGGPATDAGSRLILTTHNYSKSPFYELAPKVEPPPLATASAPDQQQHHTIDSSTNVEPAIPEDQSLILTNSSSETLYGTYDNDTNCITIVLTEEEDEDRLEGATVKLENELEMSCDANVVDQEETVTTGLEMMSPLTIRPPSPLQELLSPIAPHGLKSPGGFSSVSDAGYESIGSPTHSLFSSSSQTEISIPSSSNSGVDEEDGLPSDYGLGSLNEFWNLDLFPILE